jgi:hypothetical protein
MVNTLFAGKVTFVNQVVINIWLCCHRLAGGGVEWLGKKIRIISSIYSSVLYFIQVEDSWTKSKAIITSICYLKKTIIFA